MKIRLHNILIVLGLLLLINSCDKKNYSLGDLTPPANVAVTAELVGKDATHPNGDGSGNVTISVTSDYALSYKIQFDSSSDPVYVPSGTTTHKYVDPGLHTYTITAYVYGKGGVSSSASTQVTVQVDFVPDPAIITSLTNDDSKTWVVNKNVPGHFGVGPWDPTSTSPVWWAAGINEKVACCNCFYTATYTFSKSGDNYTLAVATPDGAFTKTGSLTTLPGIPSSGDEACYAYTGGTNSFKFVPASSGVDASVSTQTSILLSGVNTFIGYGATLKEYEILSISDTEVYLRVQGTETGNAWYLKLTPKQ